MRDLQPGRFTHARALGYGQQRRWLLGQLLILVHLPLFATGEVTISRIGLLLRTHPPTEEQIRHLLEMAPQAPPMLTAFDGLERLPGAFARSPLRQVRFPLGMPTPPGLRSGPPAVRRTGAHARTS